MLVRISWSVLCNHLYLSSLCVDCQLQKHELIEQLKRELAEAKAKIGKGSMTNITTVINGIDSPKEHVS